MHLARLRSLPGEFYEPTAPSVLPTEYFSDKEPEFRLAFEIDGFLEPQILPEAHQPDASRAITI